MGLDTNVESVDSTEVDGQVLVQILDDGKYIQPYLVHVQTSTTSIIFPQQFSVPTYLHSCPMLEHEDEQESGLVAGQTVLSTRNVMLE